MASLGELLEQVTPQWRSTDPTGGYIASELKKIHDDSMSVFPESVYSVEGARRQTRWKSTMHSDFIPISELQAQSEMKKFGVKAHMGNAPEDDCGVAGTLGRGGLSRFQSWKVPSRLTDNESRADSRMTIGSPVKEMGSAKIESLREKSALPQINSPHPRPSSRHPLCVTPGINPGKTSKHSKNLAAKMLFEKYHPIDGTGMAKPWHSHDSGLQLKLAEHAMKSGQPGQNDDVTKPVKKWLQEASPKEREVALTFFKSLAGTQFMGGTQEKKKRNEQVLELLENPPNKYSDDGNNGDNLQRVRHLNVLSPAARQNKWRHQTWHKLPSYPSKNKVLNKSAILIEPHGTVPRHFTIHPDWGP